MPRQRRRAAVYARFSTDLQRDKSIDDQVALCAAYAAREGLSVSKVYADRARTSATLIGRDGLQDLLADAREDRFDAVIVEALDRLSRDQGDLSGIWKRLEFLNIPILAVNDGQADAIRVGVHGLLGQIWLDGHRKKVHRGQAGVARDGQHAGGKSYGYRPVPGKPGELEIADHEAEVVRRIFEGYASGESPRRIAAALSADAVPPPRGTRWNVSTINGRVELVDAGSAWLALLAPQVPFYPFGRCCSHSRGFQVFDAVARSAMIAASAALVPRQGSPGSFGHAAAGIAPARHDAAPVSASFPTLRCRPTGRRIRVGGTGAPLSRSHFAPASRRLA